MIESSVPAVAKGTTVTKNAKLDVPAQGRLVLISDSGQVVTVNGPFSGPPPAPSGPEVPGDAATHVLSALLNHTQTEVGVTRAVDWRADAIARPADVDAIDASDGGDVCLADPARAVVMHDPAATGAMTVRSVTGTSEAKLSWNKGTVRQAWPASFPLQDGDMVSFELGGQDQAVLATIHILPPQSSGGDVARAMQLAQAGCTDQARLLLGLIAKAAR